MGLPRSRTAWLAKFLTHGEWVCGHEEARHLRSLDDVKAWFSQEKVGTCETAVAPFWRLLLRQVPDIRIVVVRRPVDEVVESLAAFGFDRAVMAPLMARLDKKLAQIVRRTGALEVTFDGLNDEATCKAVFEHCLEQPFDRAHWQRLAGENVQCDMQALVRYCAAYRPQMEKLAKVAKHRMLTALAVREPVTDAMTFETVSCDTWLAESAHLFDEHLVQVGEAPEDWKGKNLPLMRALDEMGAMQIMVARCNGRMFGYLMTVLCPSLADADLLTASHTTFFASPDAPGVGLKLQRAAIKALKERGVAEVGMIAGVRGSGERIASIYKRLGAAEDGQIFRLNLAEI